jgi:predicted GNAT family N-acyltransferase
MANSQNWTGHFTVFAMTRADRTDYRVRAADWLADQPDIAAIRRAVFIEEQGVPESMEWELLDPECAWFIAEAAGALVGIVRLTPAGRLGRMAVLPDWRRAGVGSSLLAAALSAAAAQGLGQVNLHAQVSAVAFYQRFGFVSEGEEFQEAGIAHQAMSIEIG